MEIIWKNFKQILGEARQRFIPFKTVKRNSDPEYYNAKIRRMKRKMRRAYNDRHRSETHLMKFYNLFKELETKKKIAQ